MKNLKIMCSSCNKNLLTKNEKPQYVNINGVPELVCQSCYKFIYLKKHGFKEKRS